MNEQGRPRLCGTQLRRRAGRAGAVGLAATVLLSGCSMQWASMSPAVGGEPERRVDEAPVAVPASLPEAPAGRVSGDLDTGSTTHRLDAGGRSVVVDYWVEDDPGTWTADRPTTIRLAAHVEEADSRHAVKVSRFGAVLDDGSRRVLITEDRGDFVLTPPYSYGGALTIPALPSDTRTAEIAVQFDLLVETEPRSDSYFRQTVLDTIQLSFATTPSEVSQ